MDHVDLKPYPMPEGVTIPRLMPYQEYPWNGDGYLAAEVLRLKAAHKLNQATETGMCLGSTTLFLSDHFDAVVTCEINRVFGNIGMARLDGRKHVAVFIRSSLEVLGASTVILAAKAPRAVTDTTLCFLDAHWGDHCPLLDELTAIAKAGVKPCIVIHDMMVYGKDFGYDKMPDGRPFSLELVAPYMNRIYGAGMWRHRTPEQTEGANRGWLSTWPASAAETMEPTEP